MVPTSINGIYVVAAVACICFDVSGTFGADSVLVIPDIHCSLAVGAATADVVGVVATDAAADAGAATVDVSVFAGAVSAGVAMWFLSTAVLSTSLVFSVKTFLFPSFLSLSILVHPLFHQATFYGARAYMHLSTCGSHPICY